MNIKAILPGVLLSLFAINDLQAQTTYEIAYWEQPRFPPYDKKKQHHFIEMYNADNLLIEKQDVAGITVRHKTVCEYNEKKQKVTQTDYDWGRLSRISHFVYNEAGILNSMRYTHMSKAYGDIETRETYFFNGLGDLIKKEINSDHSRPQTWIYKYELKEGKKRVTELYSPSPNRKLKKKKFTVYNAKGLITYEKERGRKASYTYEYDQQGNWIIQKLCVRGGDQAFMQCGEYRKTLVE